MFAVSVNQNCHKQQDLSSLHFAYSVSLSSGPNTTIRSGEEFLMVESRAAAGNLSSFSALRNVAGVNKSNFPNVWCIL